MLISELSDINRLRLSNNGGFNSVFSRAKLTALTAKKMSEFAWQPAKKEFHTYTRIPLSDTRSASGPRAAAFGYSEPYQMYPENGSFFGKNYLATDSIIPGSSIPEAYAKRLEAIGMFLASPRGVLFAAKKASMQLLNSRVATHVWNPLGLLPSPLIDLRQWSDSFININRSGYYDNWIRARYNVESNRKVQTDSIGSVLNSATSLLGIKLSDETIIDVLNRKLAAGEIRGFTTLGIEDVPGATIRQDDLKNAAFHSERPDLGALYSTIAYKEMGRMVANKKELHSWTQRANATELSTGLFSEGTDSTSETAAHSNNVVYYNRDWTTQAERNQVQKMGIGRTSHGTLGVTSVTGDNLTAKAIVGADSIPVDGSPVPEIEQSSPDFIPFRIFDIKNQKWVFLRGTITNLTDNISAQWDTSKRAGYPLNVYQYGGVDRQIAFDIKVFAQTGAEMQPMWQKIAYLIGLQYPHITDQTINDMIFKSMQSPFVKLTLGDYLVNVTGVITSLAVSVDEQTPWEVRQGQHTFSGADYKTAKLPHGVTLNMNFAIIGNMNKLPGSGLDFGHISGYGDFITA